MEASLYLLAEESLHLRSHMAKDPSREPETRISKRKKIEAIWGDKRLIHQNWTRNKNIWKKKKEAIWGNKKRLIRQNW